MSNDIQRFQDQTTGEIRAAITSIATIINKLNQENICTHQTLVKVTELEFWLNQALVFTCNAAAKQQQEQQQAAAPAANAENKTEKTTQE